MLLIIIWIKLIKCQRYSKDKIFKIIIKLLIRGIVLIVNMEKFVNPEVCSSRLGSRVDEQNLKKLYEELGKFTLI